MLGSQEDAEDVLQEVFAAAFNAICADDRPINARPWLYRIARNRCLNHLRRPTHLGQDEMDIFERDGGTTTADTVHRREEFRQIVADVQGLPETQRTALLLREIDALSYDQIAQAMDTTVPSVKSLLVRARVSLAEASEARLLTCEEVRTELGEAAEGIGKVSAPVRRHLRGCERCRIFRGELRKTSKALAAVYPIGVLVIIKKLGIAKLGFGSAGASSGSAAGGGLAGTAGIAGSAATAAGGMTAGGALSAGIGTIASKTAAGMAAAAIVTAGAVEVRQVTQPRDAAPATPAAVATATPPATGGVAAPPAGPARLDTRAKPEPAEPKEPVAEVTPVETIPVTTVEEETAVVDPTVQEDEGTVTLPPQAGQPDPAPAPPEETEHEFEPATGAPPAEPAPPPAEPQPAPQEPAPPSPPPPAP